MCRVDLSRRQAVSGHHLPPVQTHSPFTPLPWNHGRCQPRRLQHPLRSSSFLPALQRHLNPARHLPQVPTLTVVVDRDVPAPTHSSIPGESIVAVGEGSRGRLSTPIVDGKPINQVLRNLITQNDAVAPCPLRMSCSIFRRGRFCYMPQWRSVQLGKSILSFTRLANTNAFARSRSVCV
jgi:hypothetical protein